ncbi:MAG: hypothetical protein ACFE7R_06440 [Candidatus Hodarchaeota archaeon]
MSRRGRPRKHRWFIATELQSDFSREAQYLKWASANSTALQMTAALGCPECRSKNFELRHDSTYRIVRFHCLDCRYETSYRINVPKPWSFKLVPILEGGIEVGEKIVDHYHPLTNREISDFLVQRTFQNIQSGRLSLGGEWYVRMVAGISHQKRHFESFEDVRLICNWNKMQIEHETLLRQLEEDVEI